MGKTLKATITGEATIYRTDKWGYPLYSTKLCTQNKDGVWEYDYIQVQFPVGHELPNETEIKITDGFLSFFTRKNNTKEKYIRVKSYDIVNEPAGEINIPLDETDLPF